MTVLPRLQINIFHTEKKLILYIICVDFRDISIEFASVDKYFKQDMGILVRMVSSNAIGHLICQKKTIESTLNSQSILPW